MVVRKLSEYVRCLQGGEGSTSGQGGRFRKYTRGLQVPDDDPNARAEIAYAGSVIPRSVRQAERSEIWKTAMETEDEHVMSR
jgi:hypothetical protein